MDAWSRSGLPNAAEKVHSLFDETLQKYMAGDRDMKPTPEVFGALMSAWGTRNSKHGATKSSICV
jgi:hypothetical protein